MNDSMATVQAYRTASRRHLAAQRARRFALVGVLLGAVAILIATGVTFTATTGVVPVPVTGVTSSVGNVSASVLPTGVTTWAHGNTSPTPPVWSPTVGQVVDVTTAGDIAIVDARNLPRNVLVTLALTNGPGLSSAYSYMILPVQMKSWNGAAWVNQGDVAYLTLTNGYLTFLLPGGGVYEITVPTGGSIYTVDADTPANLSPTFLITADPA